MKLVFISKPIPKQIDSFILRLRITILSLLFCIMVNANPDDWHSSDRIVEDDFAPQMTCLGFVQISLDQIGQAMLTPKMFLTDTTSNPGKYKAFVMSTGATIVNCNDIGKNLQVTVLDTITRQSCWSRLKVEDKLMPRIICLGDTVSCALDPFTMDYRAFVNITDNCDASVNAFHDIQIERLNCSNPRFSTIVHLTWTAIDDYMNTSTCTQDIYFRKAPLDSVIFPLDDTLYCPNADLSLAGVPTVFGDTVSHLCSLIATHSDDTIPVCGGMIKVSRFWTVVDWCAMTMRRDTQNITVSDTTRPDIICPRDTTIFTGSRNCSANYIIPPAKATDACSPSSGIIFGLRVDSSYYARPGQSITLSVGRHTLEYIAIDPCGNTDTCRSFVTVIDRIAPTIVCPPRLILSIDARGSVFLSADHLASLGYIYDNCEVDTVLIRRMEFDCGRPQDTIFRDVVEFCCADDGTIQMVSLVAIDASGNANQCMIEVEIQNKNMTTRICPPNLTITCREDYTDLNVTGQLILVTSCSTSLIISYRDSLVTFDSCRVGQVIRKFYAEFPNGSIDSSCRQVITISNPYRLQRADIIWPRDTTINACRNQSPDSLGRVQVPQDVCSSVYISFVDSPIMIRSDSCRTYNRYWTVRQTCAPAQTFRDTQVIILQNSVAPRIIAPADILRDTRRDSCGRFVNVIATLINRCNTNLVITNNFTPNGLNASGVYPVGRTTVIFTGRDACNNIGRDTVIVEVLDPIDPDADCELIDTIMPSGGQIKLRPLDFLTFYQDNCTPNDKLRFTFTDGNFADTCRIITCDSLNTDPDTLRWRVYVVDSSGNAGVCNATVVIRDINNVCPNLLRRGTVSGLINTPDGSGMPGVSLRLQEINKTVISDDKGYYDFGIIETNKPYELIPDYTTLDWVAGLSTEDITRIQRHILSVEAFHNPWMHIAADLDKNGKVTANDMNLLRKLILGKIPSLPNQSPWRFIPKDFVFAHPDDPLSDQPTDGYKFNGFWRNAKIDMTAIKLGDISGAVGIKKANSRIRDFMLEADHKLISENSISYVDIKVADDMEFTAIQIAFLLDEMELVSIEEYFSSETPKPLSSDFYHIKDGRLLLAYHSPEKHQLTDGQILLRLQIKSKQACQLMHCLQMDNSWTCEIYPANGIPVPVRMRYIKGSPQTETVKINNWRVEPNPFRNNCFISFTSDGEALGNLNVYNLQGKLIFSGWSRVLNGNNTWLIENKDIPYPGTYLYHASIGNTSYSGKIVLSQ